MYASYTESLAAEVPFTVEHVLMFECGPAHLREVEAKEDNHWVLKLGLDGGNHRGWWLGGNRKGRRFIVQWKWSIYKAAEQ